MSQQPQQHVGGVGTWLRSPLHDGMRECGTKAVAFSGITNTRRTVLSRSVGEYSGSLSPHASAPTETLTNAPADKFPHLNHHGTDLLSGTPAERRRWAVDMLINGIIATARP